MCEVMASGTDSNGRRLPEREMSGFLPIQLMFQHHAYKTVSIFRVEIPILSPVVLLKEDMAPRLKTPIERQDWYYKGARMDDMDTLHSRGIIRNEIITVKELSVSEAEARKKEGEAVQKKQTKVAEETQGFNPEKDKLAVSQD